jgi:hypothetical protein
MSKDSMIDFCNKILEFKNAFMNNENTKSLITDKGKISFNKSTNFEEDPDFTVLQQKYNEIISSFSYDKPILVQIAIDLCADLFSNKSELLVQAEFDEINKLFVAYASNPIFKKKIDLYMPSNSKIQEILQIVKGNESPDNYNKRLLCILLFLKFKKTPDEIFVDNKYIKGGEYYSACYGPLDNYRTSFNVGLLEEMRSSLTPDLITGNYNNILQLIIIIVKMYKLTVTGTTHDYSKLTDTPLLNEFISLIQKITIENIEKHTGEIKDYFSKRTDLINKNEYLTNFKKYLLQDTSNPMIQPPEQVKLDKLIEILK